MTEFLRKLAQGDYGLAKTYWLCHILVYVLLTTVLVIVSTYAKTVSLYPPVWFSVVQSVAAALAVLQLPYLCMAVAGVWRACRRYQGWKIWSFLARCQVVLHVLTTSMWLYLDTTAPEPQIPNTIAAAWPALVTMAAVWVGWALMGRHKRHS